VIAENRQNPATALITSVPGAARQLHLTREPGARQPAVARDGLLGGLQHRSGFPHTQAAEKSQLHNSTTLALRGSNLAMASMESSSTIHLLVSQRRAIDGLVKHDRKAAPAALTRILRIIWAHTAKK
jgi:hypothetical protein